MNSKKQKVSLIGICMFLGLVTTLVADPKPDVRGFDRSGFEYSFSRADQTLDPAAWINEVKLGIAIARKNWEQLALTLYDDVVEREHAGKALDQWTETELQQRFAQWLERRFLIEQGLSLASRTSKAVQQANLLYLYKTDQDGSILYDEATGDPEVIRPDGDNPDKLLADQAAWNAQVAQSKEESLQYYRSILTALSPELLAYLEPEQRAAFAQQLENLQDRLVQRKQKELEALVAQEERIFIARRTGDVWSLRKKSESEAAAAIVADLIRETKSSCDQSLASLETKIESASAGTGDLALMGTQWLEAYKEQFQRGIDAWQKAEERFMVRRIEWEQQAGKRFTEGETAWSEAFEKLNKEQQAWEAKARILFQAGEETFKRASETLERAITEAKAEFQKDADLRSQASADRARAWVDTYVTSATMVLSARESSQYWIDKLKSKNTSSPPAIGDPALRSWVDGALKNVWKQAQQSYEKQYSNDFNALQNKKHESEWTRADIERFYQEEARKYPLFYNNSNTNIWSTWLENYDAKHAQAVAEYQNALAAFHEKHALYFRITEAVATIPEEAQALTLAGDCKTLLGAAFDPDLIQAGVEIKRWMQIYTTYADRAREAMETLTRDFDLAIGSGSGALIDVLDNAKTSEDFHLDEYQIELLRAKAVAGYWARRVDIAQAVARYAEDLTAGRTTDAESVAAWKASKARYDTALADYKAAQEALSSASTDVAASRDRLTKAAAALAQADEELEALNQEYALKMSLLAVGSADYLKSELKEKYKSLLETYGLLQKTGDEAPYVTYLERAKQYGLAESIEQTGLILKSLVTGAYGEPAISDLSRRYSALYIPEDEKPLLQTFEALGVDEHSSNYGALKSVYEAWKTSTGEEQQHYDRLIRALLLQARDEAQAALETRLDSISLLSSSTWDEWYRSRGGITDPGTPLTEDSIGQTLIEDMEQAARVYLAKRVEQELALLGYFLDPMGSVSEELKTMVSLSTLGSTIDTATAAALVQSLTLLQQKLKSLTDENPAEYRKQLEALAKTDQRIAAFLRGESACVTATGLDLVGLMLQKERMALERTRGRQLAYERYGSMGYLGAQAEQTRAWQNVTRCFTELGMATNLPYGQLPSPSVLGKQFITAAQGPEQALGTFLAALDQAMEGMPTWLKADLSFWKDALISYVAAKARYSGTSILPENPQNLMDQLKGIQEKQVAYQNLLQTLYTAPTDDARLICALLADGSPSYGEVPRDLLEQEAVHRIARSLLAKAGDLSALEESERRTRLMNDADSNHGYASGAVRTQAVTKALEDLAIQMALINKPDPATLQGEVRTQRLYQIYGELDLQGLASLVQEGLASLDFDQLHPADITSDTIGTWLPYLKTYLDRLHNAAGSAAVYEARAICLLLADQLKNYPDHLAAMLTALDLQAQGTAQTLIQLVNGQDYQLERELFIGIEENNPYYETGILYYLKKRAYQSIPENYEQEQDLVLDRLIKGGKTALVHRIRIELERFSRLINLSRAYGGTDVSGDTLSYARRQTGLSLEDQFALSRLINTGTLQDSFMKSLGLAEVQAGPQDGYTQWLATYLQGELNRYGSERARLQGRLAYAQTYEAQDEEKASSNWRVYLKESIFTQNGDTATALDEIPWTDSGTPECEGNNPRSAENWKEGTLADAFDRINLATRNLQASFTAWNEQLALLTAEQGYREKIRTYLEQPETTWNEDSIQYLPALVQDGYSNEHNQYRYSLSRLEGEQRELGRLGAAIKNYKGNESLKKEIDVLARAIADKQNAYQEQANEYAAAAETFAAEGEIYEQRYRTAKQYYEALEQARLAYEKEDAIRRWASTSYLGSDDNSSLNYRGPTAELAYTQERKTRASIALKALQDLYATSATSRPYTDDTYNALYQEYQASFDRMMLTLKVKDLVSSELTKEYERNQKLYEEYYKMLFAGDGTSNPFATPITYEEQYQVPTEVSKRSWKDIITLKNGKLSLAYDSDFKISTLDATQIETLKDFFETKETVGTDQHESTAFERSLRDLVTRLSSYNFTADKLQQWGLARDYLIKKLIEKNKDQLPFLQDAYHLADNLYNNEGNFEVHYEKLRDRMDYYRAGTQPIYQWEIDPETGKSKQVLIGYTDPGLPEAQKNAWQSLTNEEKSDLEYLALLCVTHGGGTLTGILNDMTEYTEYKVMDKIVTRWKNWEARRRSNLFYGWWAKIEYGKLKDCQNHYRGAWDSLQNKMTNGVIYLNKQPKDLKIKMSEYTISSNRIAALEGKKSAGETFSWADLEKALIASGKLNSNELVKMKQYWETSALAGSGEITNVSEALAKLSSWGRSTRDDAKRKLNTRWQDDETERQAAQQQYRDTLETYIAGKASKADLDAAARAAYGDEAASQKTHLAKLVGVYEDNLESMLNGSSAYQREYAQLGQELADSIGQTYRARFAAELAAREAEWNEERRDLQEKQAAWREAAGLILERGRADWKAGAERLRDSYTSWKKSFAEAYAQGSAAWDGAYLEGLKEKEAWAERATAAATTAASEAMLALVGQDAEAGARTFDTLGFVADLSSGAEEAKAGIRDVLSLAGIVNLTSALNASMGSAETAVSQVRTGLGGLGLWDSGKAQVAAARFTKEANQELASRQARLVAAQARDMAQASIKGLEEQVQKANENFRESMDETFVLKGSWRKEGQHYRKDVVVYSTLLDPVVTEAASVQGYIAYLMQPVSLRTDLSDTKLAQLEYSAIQALIGQAQKEVQEASEKIFGSEADNSEEAKAKRKVVYEVNKTKTVATDLWTMLTTFKTTQEVIEETNHEEREAGAGEFGAHIGYAPVTKGNPNVDDGLDNIWIDKGTGELGRLMRSYIYWSMKESQGWASVNKPMWDKPAWDDRSSWFKAPTIRGITDIGVTIAASVMLPGAGSLLMNAALNLADDAVFTMLDVGGGYKSWEEAGLEFTKKAACSAVNVGVGGVFNGFGGVSNSFFPQGNGLSGMVSSIAGTGPMGVIANTAMTGLQTLTTSTLNSAVNAITWDKDHGLGWSADAFNAGVQGGLISAATGMTSSLTSGMLNLGLEGFVGKTYANAATLSNTIGSLAGQGVNYALTGAFTLNVLNFGMFGIQDRNGNLVKNGLLELHLGRNGATMNVGMGGADVSLGTVAQSIAGLDAWRVNAELWTSKQDEAHKYTSGMRTLYSVGGAQELALYQELLSGKTNIEELADGDYKAKTEANGDGTKTIYLGQGALADGSRFGLNILLAHEAYRNGKDDGTEGQRQETQQAVLGHIGAALALSQVYGMGSIGEAMTGEVNTYLKTLQSNDFGELGKLLAGYDASGDYWRLKKDGSLVYDGFATLRDEDGNIIRSAAEMGVKETQIEGSLIKILGVDPKNKSQVEAVRRLMISAGIQHSYSSDSEQWRWGGEHTVVIGSRGSFPVTATLNLTTVNEGKSITLEGINNFYTTIGASKEQVNSFIKNTYGSAIGMLNYAGLEYRTSAEQMLAKVYSANDIKKIETNQAWYNNAIQNGIVVDAMVTGGAIRTTNFGVNTGDLPLTTSSVAGAAFFEEWHTGIDYGSGGISVQTPGGYWELYDRVEHRAYFQLFGGDIRMRIMHIDPKEINKLQLGAIYGQGTDIQKLFDYPKESYGSGTEAHVHIDFTRWLPYQGNYNRQFVNPETLKPGSIFNYAYSYKDSQKKVLPGYPSNFYRY